MMRQGRCGNSEHALNGADIRAVAPGADQQLEDAQARAIAERRQRIGRRLFALLFAFTHAIPIPLEI